MLSIALLLLVGHNAFCAARPRAVARHIDGVPQFVLDYGISLISFVYGLYTNNPQLH
jgi:hypothetical protein